MDTEKLTKQLKRHEGLRLKPYLCTAGKQSIGYGRNLEAKGITKGEAEYMLSVDIGDVMLELKNRLPIYQSLDSTRQAVLVNMGFNLGINGLLRFKNMVKALEAKDYAKAAAEMLNSNWAKQVGSRAQELALQMKTGVWND